MKDNGSGGAVVIAKGPGEGVDDRTVAMKMRSLVRDCPKQGGSQMHPQKPKSGSISRVMLITNLGVPIVRRDGR